MNETNDAITSNATLEGFELPLMPLREVVMSPHSIMPLLVGREASIKAIESAVNDYGKRICLVTQREPELEKKARSRCSSRACTASAGGL